MPVSNVSSSSTLLNGQVTLQLSRLSYCTAANLQSQLQWVHLHGQNDLDAVFGTARRMDVSEQITERHLLKLSRGRSLMVAPSRFDTCLGHENTNAFPKETIELETLRRQACEAQAQGIPHDRLPVLINIKDTAKAVSLRFRTIDRKIRRVQLNFQDETSYGTCVDILRSFHLPLIDKSGQPRPASAQPQASQAALQLRPRPSSQQFDNQSHIRRPAPAQAQTSLYTSHSQPYHNSQQFSSGLQLNPEATVQPPPSQYTSQHDTGLNDHQLTYNSQLALNYPPSAECSQVVQQAYVSASQPRISQVQVPEIPLDWLPPSAQPATQLARAPSMPPTASQRGQGTPNFSVQGNQPSMVNNVSRGLAGFGLVDSRMQPPSSRPTPTGVGFHVNDSRHEHRPVTSPTLVDHSSPDALQREMLHCNDQPFTAPRLDENRQRSPDVSPEVIPPRRILPFTTPAQPKPLNTKAQSAASPGTVTSPKQATAATKSRRQSRSNARMTTRSTRVQSIQSSTSRLGPDSVPKGRKLSKAQASAKEKIVVHEQAESLVAMAVQPNNTEFATSHELTHPLKSTPSPLTPTMPNAQLAMAATQTSPRALGETTGNVQTSVSTQASLPHDGGPAAHPYFINSDGMVAMLEDLMRRFHDFPAAEPSIAPESSLENYLSKPEEERMKILDDTMMEFRQDKNHIKLLQDVECWNAKWFGMGL